jgi:hypothetical protein
MKRIKRDIRSKNGLRVDDEDVKEAINDAIRHYRMRRFTFNEATPENGLGQTITTAAGTATYDFPSTVLDLDEVLYLQSGYNYPLVRWSWSEQKAALGDTVSSRGPARHYAVYGNDLHIFPAPDEVTTITLTGLVQLTPTPLSTPTQTNAWMTDGLALVRARASWDLSLNTLANPDRAGDFRQAEFEALNALTEETNRRLSTGCALVEDYELV